MKRLLSIFAALLLCTAIFAQTDFTSPTYTASVLKVHKASVEPIGARTLTPPVAAYHSPKYKAGVALLVLGPVKMVVGLSVLGWTLHNARPSSDVTDRGLAFGAALGTFHLLTGAALTAGGAVLLHKGRHESGNVYLRVPQPDMRISSTGNVTGVRTAVVF